MGRGKAPRWSAAEEGLLWDALEEVGEIPSGPGKSAAWARIAMRLPHGRTAESVAQHFAIMLSRGDHI